MISIYMAWNSKGQTYVGSTARPIRERLATLKYQRPDAFDGASEIALIELCDSDERYERENFWIDEIGADLNRCRAGKGPIGHKKSPEMLKSIGDASKRRWKDPKYRERRRAGLVRNPNYIATQSAKGVLGGRARAALYKDGALCQ